MTFSMTPNPVFKDAAFLKSNISKTILQTKLLKDINRKPYLLYGMVACLVTLSDL